MDVCRKMEHQTVVLYLQIFWQKEKPRTKDWETRLKNSDCEFSYIEKLGLAKYH